MKTRVSICFWPKKKRGVTTLQPDSPVTIYCRITVAGQKGKAEYSTSLDTVYGNWVAGADMGYVKGRTSADRHINTQLTKLRDELNDIHADLERQGKPVTGKRLIQLYLNNGATLSLLELVEQFIAERATLVGIDIAASSHNSNSRRFKHLAEFLTAHKLTDLRPEEFTHNLADKLLHWQLKEKGFQRNTANKTLQAVSQALRWGVRREHLDKNPMELYQFRQVAAGEIKYLTTAEVAYLTELELNNYLGRARDCFVFQCWTGLAYADLAALDVRGQAEYFRDPSGVLRRVLRVRRAKSTLTHGYECVIPLLHEAERILALYGDKLPVLSNQVYNRYLKEIGVLAELPADKMHSHIGRKTAGVLMLNAGIRMEVVSKFLGHSSVRMTEKVYAKILDRTVVNAFAEVFGGGQYVAVPPPALAPYQLAEPEPERVALRPARRIALPAAEAEVPAVAADAEANRWRRPPPVTSHDGPRRPLAA